MFFWYLYLKGIDTMLLFTPQLVYIFFVIPNMIRDSLVLYIAWGLRIKQAMTGWGLNVTIKSHFT